MVRSCVVENCPETDITILSHRFPTKRELAAKWAQNLHIEMYDLDFLYQRYTVCSRHFEESQYRNSTSRLLNFTAIPTLHPVRCRAASLTTVNQNHVTAETTTNDDPNVQSILENESSDEVTPFQIENGQSCHSNNDEDVNVLVAVDGLNLASWKIPLDQLIPDENTALDCQPVKEEELVEFFEITSQSEDVEDEDHADREPIIDIVEMDTSIENEFEDVAFQADSKEIEELSNEAYNEYSHFSRRELIERLVEQEQIIEEQQKRIKCFEEAQEKLLQSMDVFKNMMGAI